MESSGDTQDTNRESSCDKTQPKVHSIPIFVEHRGGQLDDSEPPQTSNNHSNHLINKSSEKSDTNQITDKSTRTLESGCERARSNLVDRHAVCSHDPIPLPSSSWSNNEHPTNSTDCGLESSFYKSTDDNQQHSFESSYKTSVTTPEDEYSHNGTESCRHQDDITKANSTVAIERIKSQVDELVVNVDNFTGSSSKDKQYRYLDEMLTRCMLDLDNIECGENHDIRQDRKSVIKVINQAIVSLETKLESNLTKLADVRSTEIPEQRRTYRLSRFFNRFNPFRKHSK